MAGTLPRKPAGCRHPGAREWGRARTRRDRAIGQGERIARRGGILRMRPATAVGAAAVRLNRAFGWQYNERVTRSASMVPMVLSSERPPGRHAGCSPCSPTPPAQERSTDRMSTAGDRITQLLDEFRHSRDVMVAELNKVIIGQREVIELILAAIFTRGPRPPGRRPGPGQDADGQLDRPDPRRRASSGSSSRPT